MKQILTILLAASFLPACNSKNDHTANEDSATVTENHADHEKRSEELALNNGAKWKADSTTLLNVGLLKTIVSGAQKKTVDNYVQTAQQLENGLNKMVSECKMQGADHEALHKWLEPLMEKTKDLKKVSSTEMGATIISEIEKQLNLFPKYFER